MMRRLLVLLCLTGLAAPTAAVADTFQPGNVPADARWWIHVDVDAIASSNALQETYQERIMKQPFARSLREGMWQVDLDFRPELHGVTLYGDQVGQGRGVLLLYTDPNPGGTEANQGDSTSQPADAEAAIDLPELPEIPGMKTIDYQSHTIYTWTWPQEEIAQPQVGQAQVEVQLQAKRPKAPGPEIRVQAEAQGQPAPEPPPAPPASGPAGAQARAVAPVPPENTPRSGSPAEGETPKAKPGPTVAVAFPANGPVVWASDVALVKKALDVLDGRQGGLKAPGANQAVAIPEGTMFLAGGDKLQDFNLGENAPLFEDILAFQYVEGVHSDEWFSNLTVVTDSPEANQHVKSIVDGLRSVVWLFSADQQEKADSDNEAQMKVSAEGRTIQLRMSMPLAEAQRREQPTRR